MHSLFITATDTDAGKTYISKLLLDELNAKGFRTAAMKPVASGCIDHQGMLQNEDALLLQQASSLQRPYQTINPIALPSAIAPHIAAHQVGYELRKENIMTDIQSFATDKADIHIIEGIGGWAVPINDKQLMADVVNALNLPVILIVPMKLGCLNHAILTYQAMRRSNTWLLGWIANGMHEHMESMTENIETLGAWIKAPCLGILQKDPLYESNYGRLNIDEIICQLEIRSVPRDA